MNLNWNSFFILDYVSGSYWGGQYQDGFESDLPYHTGSISTLGINASYEFENGFYSGLELSLGCQNCLDRELLKGNDGIYLFNFGHPRGQVWYASLRFPF